MEAALDLALNALWLTARVIFVGTSGFYLVSIGNPTELRAQAMTVVYLSAAPPNAVFRWRKRSREPDSYDVVTYNAATDEEVVKPALFEPARWCPTYLLWRKKDPQSKTAMMRTALLAFVMRLVFFVCFYLGSFGLLGWLAVTVSWHWFVALGVLALNQLAFSRSKRYLVWYRRWLFAVIGTGALMYLQGGTFETIAVCAVGALVMIAILGQWYMATSWRFQRMRDMGLGPFDPSRQRRLR